MTLSVPLSTSLSGPVSHGLVKSDIPSNLYLSPSGAHYKQPDGTSYYIQP